MWILAKAVGGANMLINTNNVAIFSSAGQTMTNVILRDGSDYTIIMPFEDVATMLHKNDPSSIG
jgi:hypothetical protein